MMGVSILDWVILLIIVLSVLQASAQGFFYEFFSLAGVIVGYLLAAWEYPRVAAWFAPHVNSQWAADIAGFFTIFGARRWTSLVRPLAGRGLWVSARRRDRHRRGAGARRFRAAVGTVAAVSDRAFPAGQRPRFDLGGAGGIAAALSHGLGAVTDRSPARFHSRRTAVIVTCEDGVHLWPYRSKRERLCERSIGSFDPADVQKRHNLFRRRV